MVNFGPNFTPGPYTSRSAGPAQAAGTGGGLPAGEACETPTAGLFSGQGGELGLGALAPLFAFENGLGPQQMVMLLRNLLQMPKEIVQLLALLAQVPDADTQQLLQKLLSEDVKVPLKELQTLLLTNAGQSQDKLLKLLQSSQMSMTGSGKEIGEMLSKLGQLVEKAAKSPTDALHATLQLYLPFYPLEGPQKFSMHFESLGEDEEGGGGQQAQLILYIETIAMGQFRISLAIHNQTRLDILIEHDPLPAELLQEIEQQVGEAFARENVPPPDLSFKQRAGSVAKELQSELAAVPSETKSQSVGIHPAAGVSVLTLHAAYILIRVIIEIDNRHALNTKRAG